MTTHTTAETTQTFRCAGCEQKDRRIAELEEAVRQERTAFNELHGTSEARIADLQAKLEVAERERADAALRIAELEHDVALWQHAAGA